MLKIRLQRVGRKHDPSFRVVLTDSRNAAQSGKAIETLGTYNARFGKPVLKDERITYWIGTGAQVSDTVHNLLVDAGIVKAKKMNVLPKKTAPAKEEKPASASPEETEASQEEKESGEKKEDAPTAEVSAEGADAKASA